MAAARQNEMKVNITVVATKTFTAGLDPADEAIRDMSAKTDYQDKPLEDSTAVAAGNVRYGAVRLEILIESISAAGGFTNSPCAARDMCA